MNIFKSISKLLLSVKTVNLKHTKSNRTSGVLPGPCRNMDESKKFIDSDELLKDDDDENDYYEYVMVPKCYSEENKNGVTFKGGSEEFVNAHQKITKLLNKKGAKFSINNRAIRVLDNAKNKPIKLEVKPLKGQSGRVNVKIYGLNNNGIATMMIQKTKDSQLLHVKTVAFRVIKYMLDGIIDGEIKDTDLDSFKLEENEPNKEESLACKLCEKSFKTKNGMNIHKAKIHNEYIQKNGISDSIIQNPTLEDPVNCDLCSSTFKDSETMNVHVQSCHEVKLTVAKDAEKVKVIQSSFTCEMCEEKFSHSDKLKTHMHLLHTNNIKVNDVSFVTIEENVQNTEEEEEQMDVDDDFDFVDEYIVRSHLQDEKVLRKQKELEEELRIKELEKNKDKANKEETERKRKRKMSIEKKKDKKKSRKEKLTVQNDINKERQNIQNIDMKYQPLFSEVGLDIHNYAIYKVKGDGACGSSCAGLNFHHDETLGPYVRGNVNEHIVNFFPFYEPFITFPFTQSAGAERLPPFENKDEYLKFLRTDKRSAWLWMEDHDIQALCNIYQVPVHVLTVGVEGMIEPKARWTHLQPDIRLRDFSAKLMDLPELWLMHLDKIHFDIIVSKDSDLYKEGTINQRQNKLDVDTKKNEDKEKNKVEETDEPIDGPGYMGWVNDEKIDEKIEKQTDEMKNENDFEAKLDSLKDSYEQLKRDFCELKVAFEESKKLQIKTDESKDIKMLKSEISKLKEDYKNCMDAAQNETYERNKAEEIAKVLRETLDAQNAMRESPMDVDDKLNEQMKTGGGEGEGEWIKLIRKNKKSKEINEKKSSLNCDTCEELFDVPNELKNHKETHSRKEPPHCQRCDKEFVLQSDLNQHESLHHNGVDKTNGGKSNIRCESKSFVCKVCSETFEEKGKLMEHGQSHARKNWLYCGQCDNKFEELGEIKEHEKTHNEKVKFRCNKCEREYPEMSQLRRHDWRSHREVSCNICEEMLQSRQDISNHRRAEHHILKKVLCRFYPSCLDGDECLFVHEQSSESMDTTEVPSPFCPGGNKCSDQSCQYSESNHRNEAKMQCRYQEKCNRKFCVFKHSVERKAFLGESQRKGQKT